MTVSSRFAGLYASVITCGDSFALFKYANDALEYDEQIGNRLGVICKNKILAMGRKPPVVLEKNSASPEMVKNKNEV